MRFAYFIRHPESFPVQYEMLLNDNVDVFLVTYNQPYESKDQRIHSYFFPFTSRTQGCNKLFFESLKINKEWDYYIFLDNLQLIYNENSLENNKIDKKENEYRTYESFLMKYEPAVSFIDGNDNKFSKVNNFSELCTAFHADVVKFFLPYVTDVNSHYITWKLAHAFFDGYTVKFNYIHTSCYTIEDQEVLTIEEAQDYLTEHIISPRLLKTDNPTFPIYPIYPIYPETKADYKSKVLDALTKINKNSHFYRTRTGKRNKILYCVIGLSRGTTLNYPVFMKKVYNQFDVDVAYCIEKNNTTSSDPFYTIAKYKWLYEPAKDWTKRMKEIIPNFSLFENSEGNWLGGCGNRQGSGAIMLWNRYLLLKLIEDLNLKEQYDWFVVTRTDAYIPFKFPPIDSLNETKIYGLDEQQYDGVCDRMMFIPRKYLDGVLDGTTIFKEPQLLPEKIGAEVFWKMIMRYNRCWDHFLRLPYFFYLATDGLESTRWSVAHYNEKVNQMVKYDLEVDDCKANSIVINNEENWHSFIAKKQNKKCVIITTINSPTKQTLSYINNRGEWDVIIVADSKTPLEYQNLDCIFLSLDKQKELFPDLFEVIPLNSYARKNFGYLYAYQNDYQIIYETDDDNIRPVESLQDGYDCYQELQDIVYYGNDVKRLHMHKYVLSVCIQKMKEWSCDHFTFDQANCILYLKRFSSVVKTVHKFNHISYVPKTTELIPDKDNFVNIYKYYTDKYIWPRGYPLRFIEEKGKENNLTLNPVIYQGLVDGDPDVDATFRIAFSDKFNFEKNNDTIYSLGRNMFCPSNSQNTLIVDPKVFKNLYLPSTVNMRFCDILRGYVLLQQLWKDSKTIAFTKPSAYQERNIHDLSKDLRGEIEMYAQEEKLVRLLVSNQNSSLLEIYNVLTANQIVSQNELDILKVWEGYFRCNKSNKSNKREKDKIEKKDKNYKHTRNWFYGSDINRTLLGHLDSREKHTILEIGCYEGLSTVFFADNLLDNQWSSLTCVDPFLSTSENDHKLLLSNGEEQNFDYNITICNNSEKIQVHKITSDRFFETNTKIFDLIYIDGSHESDFITRDMENSFRVLEKNGIMWMDDYKAEERIRKVMDDFLLKHSGEYMIINDGYQLAIRKL